jgi:hypothetical protein
MFLKDKAILIVIVLFSLVHAGGDAILGLQWCISPQNLYSMGIILIKKIARNNLFTYTTDSLPMNPADAEKYSLVFDGDTSLVKITMYSKTITDDLDGRQGKELFDKYSAMLKIKYKQTGFYRSVKNNDDFYQCLLQNNSCGEWIGFFTGENKSIQIELHGFDRGKGFLTISAEAVPEYSNALDYMARNKNKRDSVGF